MSLKSRLDKYLPFIATFGKLPFWIAFSLLALAIAIGTHAAVLWSEPFQITETTIQQSQSLKASIGDIQSIRLHFLGASTIRTSGREGTAEFMLDVQSTRKTAVLNVRLEKNLNVWELVAASLDGQPIEL